MAGKTIYGVILDRRMVQRWLERDSGKHRIRPEHKLLLARHLAATLWQSGDGRLPAERIERWFHAWLESETDLHRRYGRLHPDQLEEDLRNATFLACQDDRDGSSFGFAHTSLLEFFLAEYLLQAIRDQAPERWAVTRPSRETLGFLGQLLAESADPVLIQTLQSWRTPYRPQSSELLLAYAMRARERGWPLPTLRGIDLGGAQLDDWTFRSPQSMPLLDLGEADLSSASLRRVVFDRVHLAGSRFHGAHLAQASFLHCDASRTDWSGAECTATIWRKTGLETGLWRSAWGYRPQFLACEAPPLEGAVAVLPDFVASQAAPGRDLSSPLDALGEKGPIAELRIATGHRGRGMPAPSPPRVSGCSPPGTTARCACGMRRAARSCESTQVHGRATRVVRSGSQAITA